MRIQQVALTGTGPTEYKQIDLGRFRNGVGLICTLDNGASGSYSVQVSGDAIHWNNHDILFSQTTSANGSLGFPVQFVRLNGTVADGSVTMLIIQAS